MRKSIMIDMDDVITMPTIVEAIEAFSGKKIDLTKLDGYYIQDVLSDEEKKEFFSNFGEMNLYESAIPFAGCVEAIKKLNECYDIYFVTDFVWGEAVDASGVNAKNKYDFFRHFFSFINPKNIIMGGVKTIIHTDIKIDDRMCNLANANEKLLFSAYHNMDLSDEELTNENVTRVNDWNEILEVLL